MVCLTTLSANAGFWRRTPFHGANHTTSQTTHILIWLQSILKGWMGFRLFLLVVSVCLQRKSEINKKKLSRTSQKRFALIQTVRPLSDSSHCFRAGSCLAACSTTHARHILSEVLEKEGKWLPIWGGWAWGWHRQLLKLNCLVPLATERPMSKSGQNTTGVKYYILVFYSILWVSHPPFARWCYAAGRHICKLLAVYTTYGCSLPFKHVF